MLVYLALAVCAVLIGLMIWRYDLYEKEPWYMVVFAAFLGFLVMNRMGDLEELSLEALGEFGGTNLALALVAATHEEFAKLGIVAIILVFVRKQFNDPLDGIIYGSIAGLGMAVDESIFYMNLSGDLDGMLPPAEIIRLLGHPIMGGISGFALGMIPVKRKHWPWVLGLCMIFSIGLHFLWDCLALRMGDTGEATRWDSMAAIVMMVGGMVVYGGLIIVGSSWSRHHFPGSEARSVWGWPFSLFLGKRE